MQHLFAKDCLSVNMEYHNSGNPAVNLVISDIKDIVHRSNISCVIYSVIVFVTFNLQLYIQTLTQGARILIVFWIFVSKQELLLLKPNIYYPLHFTRGLARRKCQCQ